MAGSGLSLCQELGAGHGGQPKAGSGSPWLPLALTSMLGLLLVLQNASKSADASNSAAVNQRSVHLCVSVPGKVKILYEKSIPKARTDILQACISKLLLL